MKMLKSPIYVFDNIGCQVSDKKDHFLVTGELADYNTLSSEHFGVYIPYLVRNGIHWEIGIGFVESLPNRQIIVKKHKVIDKKTSGQFFGVENELYIYANSYNFDTGLKNIILKNASFKADAISAIYVLDSSSSDIDIILPPISDSENLLIEFQHMTGHHKVYLKNFDKSLVKILQVNDGCRAIAFENSWKILNYNNTQTAGIPSKEIFTQDFSALSDSTGDTGSIQYNAGGGSFGASMLYWDTTENKLLLGSSNEDQAFSVFPTSGNYDTVINQDKQNSSFIVNGSGTRNLYFDYDGRLGLNIPSGTSPQTLMHLVNMSCSEGIRLDNRSVCHPANITLFHKPKGTTISDGDVIAEIYMASNSSDNTSNDIDYVRLKGVAELSDDANRKGRFDVYTSDAGSYVRTFRSSSDYSRLGISSNHISLDNTSGINAIYNNEAIKISNTGISLESASDIKISNPDGDTTIISSAVNIGADNISVGNSSASTLTLPTVSATELSSNNIIIPNISTDSVLSIGSNNQIIAATSPKLPVSANKILSTTTGGYITGIYDVDEFFRTDNDVNWFKYTTRLATVYNRSIIFQTVVPFSEYSVGDQVELLINGVRTYRTIGAVFVADGVISEFTVGQSLGRTQLTDVEVVNITKGGYFVMGKSVAPGTVSDSTQNILSSRPNLATTFNTAQKDIDFKVYGTDAEPALYVKANVGKINTPSGFYHNFAMSLPKCEPCPKDRVAQAYEPFPITINSSGEGISNHNNSANYNRLNDPGDVLYTGLISDVGTNGRPSFFGTYDQNGNVYEWIDDLAVTSRPSFMYSAGGSYKTSASGVDFNGASILSSGLRSIQSLSAISGHDDVGLRVASIPGLEFEASLDYIENATGLNMNFATVGYENNLSDQATIYEYLPDNQRYIASEVMNLGMVRNKYRIAIFTVINDQYVKFLNIVAQYNDRGLYDSRMGSDVVGGITRYRSSSGSPWEYSIKTGMENKPVVYIDYISSLRFINWLHNGAPQSPSDIDVVLDDGAYNIFEIGADSFIVTKNPDQKYYLPNLNQWHKAAYFENLDNYSSQDVSAVSIKTEIPHLVGSGIDDQGLICNTYANLSVKGWLYADHIIIGDGSIKSASKHINCNGAFAGGTDAVGGIGSTVSSSTTTSESAVINGVSQEIPDLSTDWIPPADVVGDRLCPNHCNEFLRTSGVPLNDPRLINAVKVGQVAAGSIYCICPCANFNCQAMVGGGCSCEGSDPPNIFEPGAEPDVIDINNPAFDSIIGPGFF